MPIDELVERLGLTTEQAAQLALMDAAWVPKADLAALADQRDALMAERTNLIETKRQQLAAKDAAIERLLAERDEAREALIAWVDTAESVADRPGMDAVFHDVADETLDLIETIRGGA